MDTIRSASNPKIKEVLALGEKSKLRRDSGLFVVEGVREVSRCISAGFRFKTLFVCPELLQGALPREFGGLESIRIDTGREAYARMARRDGTEGVLGVVYERRMSLNDLKFSKPAPLIVVLESVEKPGNLGAVLRSADAAGADAVLICDPLTDLFNPNLIRASLGTVFSVQTVVCTSEEAIRFLKDNGIQILTAQLQDSEVYYDRDMSKGTALVMGAESTGLSDLWRKAADAHIRIPMLGIADSLNVSVSTAVLLFEAVRQRR